MNLPFQSRHLLFEPLVFAGGNVAGSPSPLNPAPLLPLEPNLDEDDGDPIFFNTMPLLTRYDSGDPPAKANCPLDIVLNKKPIEGNVKAAATTMGSSEQNCVSMKPTSQVASPKSPPAGKRKRKNLSKDHAVGAAIHRRFQKSDGPALDGPYISPTNCTGDREGAIDRVKDDTGSLVNEAGLTKQLLTKAAKKSHKTTVNAVQKTFAHTSKLQETNREERLAQKGKTKTKKFGSPSKSHHPQVEVSSQEKVERWLNTNDKTDTGRFLDVDAEVSFGRKGSEFQHTKDNSVKSPKHSHNLPSSQVTMSSKSAPSKKSSARSKSSRVKIPKKYFSIEAYENNPSGLAEMELHDVTHVGDNVQNGYDVDTDGSSALGLSPKKKKKFPSTDPSCDDMDTDLSSALGSPRKKKTPRSTKLCKAGAENETRATLEGSGQNLEASQSDNESKLKRRMKKKRIRSVAANSASEQDARFSCLSDASEQSEAKTAQKAKQSNVSQGKRKRTWSDFSSEPSDHEGGAPERKNQAVKRKLNATSATGIDSGCHELQQLQQQANHDATPTKTLSPVREEFTPTDHGKQPRTQGPQEENGPPAMKRPKTKQTKLNFGAKSSGNKEEVQTTKLKRKSGKDPPKKGLAAGQQRLDVMMGRQNARGGEASVAASDSVSVPSAVSEQLDRSHFDTDAEYQEYQDRLFAEKMQREFELEMKFALSAIRCKGSEGEYSLRRRKATEPSSPPPLRPRRK